MLWFLKTLTPAGNGYRISNMLGQSRSASHGKASFVLMLLMVDRTRIVQVKLESRNEEF